ncbi:PIG-L deacetylase family protein [Streptomyces sp. NPDC088270]|uniref:PIG-L deacetylase family protein n=1 Tax=Streptomyces sp. NPDC088270 TaxID=3160990 RepID=UPI00344925D2
MQSDSQLSRKADRVLVVSPHRDDETIGCGGTICAHAARGDAVGVVHLSGAGGATEAEAQAAAAVLGVTEMATLQGEPIQLGADRRLFIELVAFLRRFRPTTLYIPHVDDDDPSHRTAHELAMEARWVAAYPVHPEAGEPCSVPDEVYAYEVWTPLARPSTFVDITQFAAQKEKALRQYDSQINLARWDEGALGLNRYRGITSGCGDYAEAFCALRVPRFHARDVRG